MGSLAKLISVTPMTGLQPWFRFERPPRAYTTKNARFVHHGAIGIASRGIVARVASNHSRLLGTDLQSRSLQNDSSKHDAI